MRSKETVQKLFQAILEFQTFNAQPSLITETVLEVLAWVLDETDQSSPYDVVLNAVRELNFR